MVQIKKSNFLKFFLIFLAFISIAIFFLNKSAILKAKLINNLEQIIFPKPDEKITISAPFIKEGLPYRLLPMGEKEYHHNSEGHPGIDFQWNKPSKIYSSSNGVVRDVFRSKEDDDKWEVDVIIGDYQIRYKELESVNPELKKGKQILIGDYIGEPFRPLNLPDGNINHYQMHWEFGYGKGLRLTRLCPLDYFDDESRKIVEKIWTNTEWEFKNKYPKICNGVYDM